MAITKRQYENKAITASVTKTAPPVGTLMAGHGRLVCTRCAAVVAVCPHLGHLDRAAGTVDGCAGCRDGG